MSWQSVSDIVEDAYLSQEKPKGCRDCGAVVEYRVQTRKGLVIEYPGVECCPPAIRRQIAWRAAELDQLNKRVNERRAAVAELQRKSADGDRHSAAYAAQAARAFEAIMAPGQGEWALELKGLSGEIARLKRKLMDLEGRAS